MKTVLTGAVGAPHALLIDAVFSHHQAPNGSESLQRQRDGDASHKVEAAGKRRRWWIFSVRR